MKLREEYVLYDPSDEERIAVPTGSAAKNFSGLLRANRTAAAILEYLKEETSEEEIVQRMAERFDAEEEELRRGVREVLEILRKVGALEE